MSEAREAGRKLLTPGELYLHDELEAMRRENDNAHSQIRLNITNEVGRLHEAMDERFEAMDERFEAMDGRFEAMDERFEAMNERFDELEKTVLRAIDGGQGPDLTAP